MRVTVPRSVGPVGANPARGGATVGAGVAVESAGVSTVPDGRLGARWASGWGELVSTHEEKAARVEWVLAKPFSLSQICEIAQEITRRKQSREGSTHFTLVA